MIIAKAKEVDNIIYQMAANGNIFDTLCGPLLYKFIKSLDITILE